MRIRKHILPLLNLLSIILFFLLFNEILLGRNNYGSCLALMIILIFQLVTILFLNMPSYKIAAYNIAFFIISIFIFNYELHPDSIPPTYFMYFSLSMIFINLLGIVFGLTYLLIKGELKNLASSGRRTPSDRI